MNVRTQGLLKDGDELNQHLRDDYAIIRLFFKF